MTGRRSRSTRTVVAGGAAVVVLAGGGAAWAATRSDGPAYRLATVTRADVAQTITEVGTISSINQRSVSFPVSGTVSSVKVALGDVVAAGQTLATLDTTNLSEQVVSDNGTLASARQRLADDEASQSGDSTDAYSAEQLGGNASSGGTNPTKHSGGASVSQLQNAVVSDQHAVDAALAQVSSDLTALKTACASSTVTFSAVSDANGIVQGTVTGAAGLPVSIPTGTDAAGNAIAPSTVAADGSYTFGSATDPLRANASYTIQLGDDSAGIAAAATCGAALTTAQQDEQTVANLEHTLASDEQKLDTAIEAQGSGNSASGGSTGSGKPSGSTGSTGSTGSSGSTGSTGRGGSTGSGNTGRDNSEGGQTSGATTITAAQLAADQKSIDAAAAELVVAKQNLTEATLIAPISGTVADVAMSSGSAVSASSSSSTITIIGSGQKEVSTTVGIADVDLVKAGDTASVTIDGVSTALPGKVTQIGVMNSSGTSGDTTTYPVTIVLDPTNLALYDGAGATVAINVGTAKNVLTVPSSALTTVGTRALVSVYAKGKLTPTVVTTGVSGVDRTEVKSGLKVGEQVVLANLHEAIPNSTTNSNSRFGRVTGGGLGAGLGGGLGGGRAVRIGGN